MLNYNVTKYPQYCPHRLKLIGSQSLHQGTLSAACFPSEQRPLVAPYI